MRIKNTYFNIISNFLILLFKTILLFIVRKVFISTLGVTYLGVDGLLSNILSVLSVAELGIGSAISFSLYEPLSKKDTKKISVLMSFYKRAYMFIGCVILSIGIILYFFLGYFNLNGINNIALIYFLYLFNIVSLYFISYKETLIIADQKKYKLAIFETIFVILLNVIQIFVLLFTKNYIYFILVMVLCNLVQRVLINRFISKEYSTIDFNCNQKLCNKDLMVIKKNVGSLVFHKIGDYLINGVDNIIISTYSLNSVGIYSNYLMIVTALQSFLMVIFNGMVASLGNLVATENKQVQENIFDIMNFVGFIAFGYSALCFFILANSFIEIAFGSEYLLPQVVVFVIAINIYLSGLRIINVTMVNASGIIHKTRFDPFVQAVVNLIVSFAFVHQFGILAVVIGTMVSGILVTNWHTPYVIYKCLFSKNFLCYLKSLTKNFIVIFMVGLIMYYLSTLFSVSIFTFILQAFIFFIIFISAVLLVYGNSNEFKSFYNSVKLFIKKTTIDS